MNRKHDEEYVWSGREKKERCVVLETYGSWCVVCFWVALGQHWNGSKQEKTKIEEKFGSGKIGSSEATCKRVITVEVSGFALLEG